MHIVSSSGCSANTFDATRSLVQCDQRWPDDWLAVMVLPCSPELTGSAFVASL